MQANPASEVDVGTYDRDIAARIAEGDRDALVALMQRYNQTLYRTARSILRDEAEAEDAVQEAWLSAYRAIDRFRADARLSTWLVRIVVNEALGRVRARKRRGEVVWIDRSAPLHEPEDETEHESMSEESWGQPESALAQAQTRRMIEGAIDRLPAVFRTVFVLRAVEDMSVEETGHCLGIPAATVRTRYFRARALLRAALAREIELSIDQSFSFAGERCARIVAGVLERLDDAPGPPGSLPRDRD